MDEYADGREARLVRPYTWTAGRTDTDVDLPLEAPIQTIVTDPAPAHRWPPDDARSRIVGLCVSCPSVSRAS